MSTSQEPTQEILPEKESLKEPARKTSLSQEKDADRHLSATIRVSPEVAYLFFRDFQNLPLFMKDLSKVEILSDSRFRWVVEAKGLKAEWETEITEEKPGELIAWKSREGSEVETHGSIRFRPAPENQGTTVSLALGYKVSGEDPASLTFTNLRRLKCLLETGEIATTDGQPTGRDENARMIDKK